MTKNLIGLWQPVSGETKEEFANRVKEDLRRQGLLADGKRTHHNEVEEASASKTRIEAFKRNVKDALRKQGLLPPLDSPGDDGR